MSSKRSPAARVLDFFAHAPIGEADLLLGLVKEAVKMRKLTNDGRVAEPVTTPRKRTRRPKANAKPTTDSVGPAIGAA